PGNRPGLQHLMKLDDYEESDRWPSPRVKARARRHHSRASVALRRIPPELITDDRIRIGPKVLSAQTVNIVARIGRTLLTDSVGVLVPARFTSIDVGIARPHLIALRTIRRLGERRRRQS